jgi:WD40 repeat protein
MLQQVKYDLGLDVREYGSMMQVSSSGERLLWCHEDVFHIFVFMGMQLTMVRRDKVKELYRAKFSPDGMLVVSYNKRGVEIWNAESGELIKQLKGHQEGVYSIAFTQDGNFLTSASEDMILWWDLRALFSGM